MDAAYKIIGPELKAFEQYFAASLKSQNPLLDRVLKFIIKRKGKQMRPMFVLLAAKICGSVSEPAYHAAALIELLHTATLVHDDVVDNSMLRRNFFSINALWKNKIAVLVGDYLLSKGLLLAVEKETFDLLRITSQAVREMSEGELLQIEKARRLDITEEVYFDIIRAKTASLLAAACSAGAQAASKLPEDVARFRLFGEKVGIAFQIKDDLFDYGQEDVGKPTGNDIREKKMTLPLIYALQHMDKANRRRVIYTVKNNNNDKHKVREVIDLVHASGGIEYARRMMLQYREEALEILKYYPETEARRAMESLVNYVIERRY